MNKEEILVCSVKKQHLFSVYFNYFRRKEFFTRAKYVEKLIPVFFIHFTISFSISVPKIAISYPINLNIYTYLTCPSQVTEEFITQTPPSSHERSILILYFVFWNSIWYRISVRMKSFHEI